MERTCFSCSMEAIDIENLLSNFNRFSSNEVLVDIDAPEGYFSYELPKKLLNFNNTNILELVQKNDENLHRNIQIPVYSLGKKKRVPKNYPKKRVRTKILEDLGNQNILMEEEDPENSSREQRKFQALLRRIEAQEKNGKKEKEIEKEEPLNEEDEEIDQDDEVDYEDESDDSDESSDGEKRKKVKKGGKKKKVGKKNSTVKNKKTKKKKNQTKGRSKKPTTRSSIKTSGKGKRKRENFEASSDGNDSQESSDENEGKPIEPVKRKYKRKRKKRKIAVGRNKIVLESPKRMKKRVGRPKGPKKRSKIKKKIKSDDEFVDDDHSSDSVDKDSGDKDNGGGKKKRVRRPRKMATRSSVKKKKEQDQQNEMRMMEEAMQMDDKGEIGRIVYKENDRLGYFDFLKNKLVDIILNEFEDDEDEDSDVDELVGLRNKIVDLFNITDRIEKKNEVNLKIKSEDKGKGGEFKKERIFVDKKDISVNNINFDEEDEDENIGRTKIIERKVIGISPKEKVNTKPLKKSKKKKKKEKRKLKKKEEKLEKKKVLKLKVDVKKAKTLKVINRIPKKKTPLLNAIPKKVKIYSPRSNINAVPIPIHTSQPTVNILPQRIQQRRRIVDPSYQRIPRRKHQEVDNRGDIREGNQHSIRNRPELTMQNPKKKRLRERDIDVL